MKKWVKYYTNISPKKGYIDVIRQTFESKDPTFRNKKRMKTELVSRTQIMIDIPKKEEIREVEHYDSTAFQSDDRFFTTKERHVVYDKDVLDKIRQEALYGYNTEPIEII